MSMDTVDTYQTHLDYLLDTRTVTNIYCSIGLIADNGCAYQSCEECEHSIIEEVVL